MSSRSYVDENLSPIPVHLGRAFSILHPSIAKTIGT